jgi:hypothetical protein
MIAPQKPVMWNGSGSLPTTRLVSHSSSALTIYGGPLRLASAARRFDVSLATGAPDRGSGPTGTATMKESGGEEYGR